MSDFNSKIIELVKLIPKGKVATYGQLAELTGIRSSARMVGWVLNKQFGNLEIPCHRVVNRYGNLSGKLHFPTPTYMEEMLKAEGVEFKEDGTVNLSKHLFDFDIQIMS